MYLLPTTYRSDALVHTTNILPRSIDKTQCGFEGNNDIYGIGIRIGIYAQILAVWFANYFLFAEAQVLRDSVSIFSFALLIVALIYAANPQDVYAVEGFVLLQILAWSCIMGVRAKSSYTKGIFSRGSFLRRSVCEVVNLVNVGLQVWFWYVGIGRMKKTPCGTYIMMYVVKTGMFGWARKVMMAMSLFVLLCTVYWASMEFLRPWTLWKISKAREEFVAAVKKWEQEASESAGDANTTEEQDDKDTDSVCRCADMDDACSKSFCLHCSPTESYFGNDCDTVLSPESKREPVENSTTEYTSSPRISVHEDNPAISTRMSLKHQADKSPIESSTLLQSVCESELYIQYCISASPYQMSADGKPLTLSVIIHSILFPSKHRAANTANSPPSWFRCHLHTWKLFFTFRFPPQAFVVYSHLRQSRLLDPLNGPFQLYGAVTYKPASGGDLPDWSSVSIASSLLLAAPETLKKVWLGWYYAILDLAIHIIVIIQLELTLRWNSVNGLSDLWTSIGQLLPFIIGVGGLMLVGGRWAIRVWVKWKRGAGRSSGWEDSTLLLEDGEKEQHGETFGLEKSVGDRYAMWKELQKVQPHPLSGSL